MEECIKLIVVLAVLAMANIIGGIINNIKLRKFAFSWKKLLSGVIQFAGFGFMFIALAYCIETIPEIGNALGVQPKAMILAAVLVYAGKVFDQLNDTFNLKKQIKVNGEIKANTENEKESEDAEYMDM